MMKTKRKNIIIITTIMMKMKSMNIIIIMTIRKDALAGTAIIITMMKVKPKNTASAPSSITAANRWTS